MAVFGANAHSTAGSSKRPTHARPPRARRPVVVAAVLAVLATYSVVNPSWASAAALTGSDFEIDANLVVDGASPATDWLTGGAGSHMRSDVLVRNDRPTGKNDDAFTGGTDINDTPTTITTGGIPNHKSDLTRFGILVDKQPTDAFVNVFWTRVQAPSGTTTMDFEFNQSAVRSNAISPSNADVTTTTIPLRTPGDILITYLLESGGTHPTLTRRTWTGTVWGPSTTFSASDALADINTTAISATNSDGLGPLDAFTFGEASIRLSAFVPPSDVCTTFGSVYLRSRSSATDTDENKDFIAPEPVTISNCGSIRIHKTEGHGAGPLAGAVFTLYKDVPTTGGTAAGAEDMTLANTVGTCLTDTSGDCPAFTNVKKGEYWVVETTVPLGHDKAPDQHVSITEGDQVRSLTFDDPIQYGTVVVQKRATPADGTDFDFTLDSRSFQLDVDNDATLPSQRTYQVVVGSHTVGEGSLPAGWALSSSTCRDGEQIVAHAGASLTFDVPKDHTITCTFVNDYTTTRPVMTTTAAETAAGGGWNDTATLTGDGTHAVTGSVAFFVCGPTASAGGCASTTTQVGADVAVHSGSATTSVAYTPPDAGWYCFRAVYSSTSAYYRGTSHTNDSTECFLKQNADLQVTKTAVPSFGRAYTWDAQKVVDGDARVQVPAGTTHAFPYEVSVSHSQTDSSWRVTGLITVSNSNNVAFSGVGVSDAINDAAGTCSVPNGSNVTVPANDRVTLAYTCTYASAPSAARTNTASATWDGAAYFTPASTATGTASVDFSGVHPSTTDQVVTVTDTLRGTLGTLDGATAENPTVYTYSVEQTAPQGTCSTYPNTASVTTIRGVGEELLLGQSPVTLDTASASATLCGGLPLAVEATAAGSFDRAFQWLIDKTVDRTNVLINNGQRATFNYTVTVTPNGALDSGYALGGTVQVTNPNAFEAVTADVAVTTDLGGGAVCSVVDGSGAVISAGGSSSFSYTCAFSGTPTLTGTVTATASWNAGTAATTASSTPASQPVSLVVATETNRTITVTDDKTDPANPVQLGTWTFNDGQHAFTYSLTKAGVFGTVAGDVCTDYTNVATIVETAQSDTQVVTLCDRFNGGSGNPPVINPPKVTPPKTVTLPFTGDGLGLLARESIGLMLSGLLLLVLSRKRRQA